MKETATRPNAGPIAGSHSGPSNVLMGMTQQLAEQAHRLESVTEQMATGLDKIAASLDRLEAAADESATVARDSRTMQDALVAVAALEEVRAQLQEADQEIELLRRCRVEDIARIRSLAADRDALETEMQANAARHRRELVKLNAAPSLPSLPPAPPPPTPVFQAVPLQSTISPAKVASDVAFTRRVYKTEMPPFTRNGPLDQNKAEALLEHARSVMRSRDWAAAATAYADYLSYQPLRARQWKQYGHALKEMGDLNGSERAYYRALTLEPSDCDTAIHLAHVLKDQGLLDAAAEVFAAVLQMAPGSVSAREGLAFLGYPEPEGLSPLPASRRPSMLQRYMFKKDLAAAKQAARGRDWAKAAEIYGQLSARRPLEAGLVIRRGHALKELGKLEDAAAMYRKALLLEPLSSDAHLQLGHALKLLGDRDGARRSYISAVRFGPDNQDALDEL